MAWQTIVGIKIIVEQLVSILIPVQTQRFLADNLLCASV